MVELVKLDVDGVKEGKEVMDALEAIVVATVQAAKDGFQAGQDIPPIVAAAWSKLPAAIEGIQKIGEEATMSPFELIQTCSVGSVKIAKAIVKG